MARFEQMRDRLPTLYRPEDADTGLLSLTLRAVGDVLEELNREAGDVLQAHWFEYADWASYNPFLVRGRALAGLAALNPGDLVDIADPMALTLRLRAAPDPLSGYLRERFSPQTRRLLDEPSSPTIALQRALIGELNRIVRGESIFDEDRFAGIQLSEETRDLLDSEPRGDNLVQLNRRLLEEAYPGEIVRSPLDHLYIHDLARLAALLALPPWRDPPALRETVEEYRQRIRRIVALYRNGLGTAGALRRMIEAQLPVDLEGLLEERDRPFLLEEFAPLVTRSQPIMMPGEPLDLVGPLMRWRVENDGLATALPTVYIQGVEPQENEVAATRDPLIELYYGDGVPPLGIAYQDTVAPGETLRLRPAYASWTGHEGGLRRARARPTETTPADPTAPGPWQRVEGAPEATVVALHQSHDRTLWVATDDGTGELWRFDGQDWVSAVSDLPVPHCLAEDGRDLLIGTAEGLFRVPLYPAEAGSFAADPVQGLEDQAVHALLYAEGRWWLGTSGGIALLEEDDEVRPFGLGEDQGTAIEVYAVHQDGSGTLHFGTELGLFQYQPGTDDWYYYVGGTSTDEGDDWREFTPGAGSLPGEGEIFLPPVRAVRRGPDASLWLGTDHGIARYLARWEEQELTYTTVLEAFPDLTEGRVFAIEEDARGLVWFCTDRGLLRYDGRDFWQARSDGWKQLGSAASLFDGQPEPRGSWYFVRSTSKWERIGTEEAFSGALRTTRPDAVRAIRWTDQVEADRGQWDGEKFTRGSGVSEAKLRVRCKPREDAILDGGLPAVPRLPVGHSEWRYLSLEPEGLEEPEGRPSWTIEGRLLPPPDRPAPWPGRYDLPPPSSTFGEAVFAFEPAARVWFEWAARRPLMVVARLQRRSAGENFDPAVLDRVWQGIQQVRPAGVRAALRIEEELVRGGKDDG